MSSYQTSGSYDGAQSQSYSAGYSVGGGFVTPSGSSSSSSTYAYGVTTSTPHKALYFTSATPRNATTRNDYGRELDTTPVFIKDRLRYHSAPDPSVYGKCGNPEWNPESVPSFMQGAGLSSGHNHLLR